MKTLTERDGNPLCINAERLWSRHMEMAEIGKIEITGNCRLALSEDDARARSLFAKWCHDAGLEMHSDRAGNMFAIRAGSDPKMKIVAAGSHLDTQPHGGRFDGISGVLAALEVVETLNDLAIETVAPIAVINWTNEEGVRFAPGLLGSTWFAGQISDDELDAIRSTDGSTFAEDVSKIGWRGEKTPDDFKLDSFFELHIEQGPILDRAGVPVGVVTSVQGLCWLDVVVTGADAHAGTTPLDTRKDALLAAAAMLVELRELGLRSGKDARVSVGKLRSATEGPSTISGRTEFVIDVRHPDAETLSALISDCELICESVARRYDCDSKVSLRLKVPPRNFDAGCVELLEAVTTELELPHLQLPSGALHDASNVAALVPTAMIFVSCKDGISHNVKEYASPEDLAAGTNVLLHTMLHRALV